MAIIWLSSLPLVDLSRLVKLPFDLLDDEINSRVALALATETVDTYTNIFIVE